MNKFGVYQIELNNKIYVGSTVASFEHRWNIHLRKLRKGKGSRYLQNAYNKYGEDALNFSILEVVKNKEDCIPKEQYYIDTLHPQYNISQTAGSCLGTKRTYEQKKRIAIAASIAMKGRKFSEEHKKNLKRAVGKFNRDTKTGIKLSEEHKKKLREALKGNTFSLGRKRSDETKRKISESMKGNKIWLGKKHTEETKQKLREINKGNTYGLGYKHTDEAKQKMSIAGKGKKLTEEHKRKIGLARMGKKHSEETRQKISKAQKLRYTGEALY
jgi:group I intron endonuclease